MTDKSTEIKTRVGTVALVGRPNAGKSTLLNRILGQKIAIISDKPQTTRTSILGIHTTEAGQIIFIDNPGIHKPLHKLNRRMMNIVYSSLETSDLVCLLIDASLKYGHGDEYVIELLKKLSTPVILLINKVDRVKKSKALPLIAQYKDLLPFAEIIPISALDGTNIDLLEETIFKHLPVADKIYDDDDISIQSMRFLLSEIIREKILHHVREELPFTTAVMVETIEDRPPENKPDAQTRKYIKAQIIVEKDNHRKIIIGRQGSLVRTIGQEARIEIEEIMEAKVFLDLQIKVRERWRDAADVLNLIEQQ